MEESHHHIALSTGTIIRTFMVGIGFFLAWTLRDILLVVLTAVVLASAFEPGIRFLTKKRVPRLLSVVLIYAFALLGFGTAVSLLVPAFFDDISHLVSSLPRILGTGKALTGAQLSGIIPGDFSSEDITAVLEVLKSGFAGKGILATVSTFFGGIVSFLLVVVFSFYFSAQERGIENFLRIFAPAHSRTYILDLWRRSQRKIGLWFQGQMLLGVLVGVLTFLGLTILGVPSAFFLALLIALFEIIPVFGPVLAAVPGVALAFESGTVAADPGVTAALMVAAFYFIVQQFESHLIYPLVVRKVIGIPPVLVILALVVGGTLGGFLGVLLSVPVTAVLMEYIDDMAKEKRAFDDD